MKLRKISTLLFASASMVCSVAPASAEFKLKGDLKPAMILYSPKDDKSWSAAFDHARLAMEKDLGVSIPLVENIPENATAIRPAVELLISKGHNVIIGTAFGYSDTFKELAEKHPDVAFFNGAGTTNGTNLESFYGRTYESQYLCGMAAASASKSGQLGYVAANPFGLVNWAINAFAMGARQVRPDATVTVVFTGSWNDAVKERASAIALLDQGKDVLGQHVANSAVQTVAEERKAFVTGHHFDLTSIAPNATLCTSAWTWDKFLTPRLKEVKAGTWKPSPYGAFLSIKEGGTDAICCGKGVPAAEAEKIKKARQEIIDGTRQVYAGPLKDRDGKERVPVGKVLGDAELWSMDWYVDGVVASK